jgi:predicted secreted protein
MGSSYRATVTQLAQLNKIPREVANHLRAQEPIDIKVRLGGGRRPENPRADVWDVDESRSARSLALRIDDELHVRLSEIPTSGYRWDIAVEGAALEPVLDELESDLSVTERVGSARRRHMWWRAVAPGVAELSLRLVREWDQAQRPADEVDLALRVQTPRTGLQSTTGVTLPQRLALLAEAA